MYDFGYRQAKNYKTILRFWEPRMKQYFLIGECDDVFGRNGSVATREVENDREQQQPMEDEELCPCGCRKRGML